MVRRIARSLVVLVWIMLVASAVNVVVSPQIAYAASLTVNSKADVIADDGDCTLREAITAANSDTASGATPGECLAGSGADTISFSISDTPDYTVDGNNGYSISLTADLPDVTEQLTIDASTQTGGSCADRFYMIELNGAATADHILAFRAGSDNSVVKGFVLNRAINTIMVGGNNGLTVQCNAFGMNTAGTASAGGTQLSAIKTDASDPANGMIIGGSTTGQGNFFAGYTDSCCGMINTQNSNSNIIKGNVFGLSFDKSTLVPHNLAIGLGGADGGSSNNIVGGIDPGAANVIVGATANANSGGIVISGLAGNSSNGNFVQGNYIGVDDDGVVRSGYGAVGFGINFVGSGSGNLIGGATAGQGNVIAGNAEGVMVYELQTFGWLPTGNSIIGNSIYDNDGIGIRFIQDTNGDFSPDAGIPIPIDNDAGDGDAGPNDLLNRPVIESAEQNNYTLSVSLSLDVAGAPGGQYRVELFANDVADGNGYSQGKTYLGSVNLPAGSNQDAAITMTSNTSLAGKYLSATATQIDGEASSGFASTSQFGKMIEGQQIVVVAAANGLPDVLPAVGSGISMFIMTLIAFLVASAAGGLQHYLRRV